MTRVVFGIMSAFQRPATVSQLVAALGDRPVVIHHDFNQRPAFSIDAPGVRFVPDPALTGWGTWGFCEAIVRTLEYCLEHVPFDYFQLLSPTCLPLRPIEQLEQHLMSSGCDGHIDLMELKQDPDVMMTFGWRFLAPRGSLKLAALRRARSWYFDGGAESRHRTGLSVLMRGAPPALGEPLARLAEVSTRLALDGWLSGGTPFGADFRPYVGSCWFAASRGLAERIVLAAREPRIKSFFEHLPNADESFFPTVIGNSGLRIGSSNHLVNFFNDTGNPHWLRPGDLGRIVGSRAYFGRKFPDDPQAQIRLEVLDRVAPEICWRSGPGGGGRRSAGPRLAFGVLSGSAQPAIIGQLAHTLAPHPLVVHQDPAQQPDFSLDQANVHFVDGAMVTPAGTWAWSMGVLRLLRYCLDHVEFDYLQLLNPLCLPIRPIDRFAQFIAASEVDAHASMFEVAGVAPVITFGPRVFAAGGSWHRKARERLSVAWAGLDPVVRERAGLPVLQQSARLSWGVDRLAALCARLAGRAPFSVPAPDPRVRPFVGSPWFGATREVCEHLVRRAAVPELNDYFARLDAGGDIVFATLLAESGFRCDPSNLCFGPLDGRRERWVRTDEALDRLLDGTGFFAGRFSDDPDSPVRRRMLALLGASETQEAQVA